MARSPATTPRWIGSARRCRRWCRHGLVLIEHVFATLVAVAELRWKLADEEGSSPQGELFAADDLVERHVGTGEFRGMEFLHVNARRVINEVPAASRMPFRYTINAYRGCTHACTYCLSPETPVLLGDGSHRSIGELRI